MKDVLSFNLQRFNIQVGGSTYTSLTDAFTAQSGTSGALTFTFLGDDSSTGLTLADKTYTFNLNGHVFTGDVDLTNANLTIGTETSAFTFSGIYKVDPDDTNGTTYAITGFDSSGTDKVSTTGGTFGGSIESGVKIGSYTLSGLPVITSADAWSNTAVNTYTWNQNVSSGAAIADSNKEINYQESSTNRYFTIDNINSPVGKESSFAPDASNTLTLDSTYLIVGSSVTLTNSGNYSYTLALADSASGTTTTSGTPAWEYSSGTASYLSYSTSTGFALTDETHIDYNTSYGSTTYTALTGVKGTEGLTINTTASSVTVANAALSETDVSFTFQNGYTFALANDVSETSEVAARFGALASNTAIYYDAYNTAGYGLAQSNTVISYTAAGNSESQLFSLAGITSTEGLAPDDSSTITVGITNLGGSNVTLANIAEGAEYKLALGSDVDTVTYVAEHFSTFTGAGGTATYVSASNNEGYTLSNTSLITYTEAVDSSTLFTLSGVADVGSNSVVVSANVVTLSETALNQANVYLTNGDSQTFMLALAEGIDSSTTMPAYFGAVDASNTAVYYDAYNTAGYALSGTTVVEYTAATSSTTSLFTLAGIAATDGIEVDASNTVTLISDNLGGSNVTLANATESATYTLALNETVSAPVTYAEGLYSNTASTAAWQTEHNTAGYSSTSVTEITYTSEVAAVDLIGVSDIATFSTSLIDFGSATLAVKSADDVLTLKNTSNSDVSVAQFGDDLTMANADSIVANQYWAWQESNSGTLHYESTVNLTNVSGIDANTTGITLDGKTLILPTGVTVLDGSGTGKSQATGVENVKVGTKTYDVENGYLINETINSDVSVIQFDGSTITLVNSEGATIASEEVTYSDYATSDGNQLTIKPVVQSTDVQVVNTSSSADVFVTNGTYTISLNESDTMLGDGSSMASAESWKYASNTLTNGGSDGVTLSSITLSAVTDTNITFSGSNANIEGAGVSYKGVSGTTSDSTIVAAAEGVVTLQGANVSLASGSNVSLADSTNDTINGKKFVTWDESNVGATMGSSALTVEGNVYYENNYLSVLEGSIAINNSDATDVTLNNSTRVSTSNSDVALSLATGATVTINEVGGLAATETKITPVSSGVAFTPNSGTVAYGENITFTGGKASIGYGASSSAEITLFSDASVTSSDGGGSYIVNTTASTAPAYINGKAMLVTGGSDVSVTSTTDGFTVGDESLSITGDSTYTVTAATGDIQSVQGISAGAVVVPNAGAIDIITDEAGAFTIGERTVTISGDTLVAFGASDSILTSVSSLNGAIAGSFENAVTVDGGAVQILGDNEVTVTGADTVLSAISGVGADSVTVASAGGATTLTTDANGIYQFGSAHVFGVNDADATVNFLLSSSSDVSVTGVDRLDDGTIVLNQDETEFFVNGMSITVGGGVSTDSSVTLTTADGEVTSVEGLFGSINGLTGNVTVSAIDSDVTVNGATIQLSEVDSTAFEVQVESGTVKAVTGINAGATITTAKNVSVVTSEQGTFTFPNGIFNVSDTDGVSFVTDANSNVVDIQGFAGTLTSNQNNVTVNGAAIYTSNTDASLVSSGSGVGTISGLKDEDSVTAPDGTQVMMPAESELNVNNRNYTLTSDEDGVSISGSSQPTVSGLDSSAILEVANGGTYIVNGTRLQAVNGSKIIGDPEGTAHIYEDSDIYFESDTEVAAIIEAVTGISETDTRQTNVSTDSTLGESLNEGDTSGADGNLKVTLTNTSTDTETAQTVNFASNTGVKNATLESGIQNLTFNNEGGNVAVVGSDSTGEKNITLGNGGDVVIVEAESKAPVSVKAGTGKDTIVTAGDSLTADLSAGGATRVMATAGKVTLNGYNPDTGAGIQVTNSNIYESIKDSSIIALGDGAVSMKGANITTNSNASPEGSSVINFFNLKGEKYQVGYAHSGGGEVDRSQSKEGVILKGNYAGAGSNNVLRGGNGDDSVLAGGNDIVDAGAGSNQIEISKGSASGATTVRQTATSGNTTVTGFGFGFGENQDRISITQDDNTSVEYNSANGQVTFTRGNAKLVVNGTSSSPDLASSGDLASDGASQQILIGEGDNLTKLEVAEKNAVISISDNSDSRAGAYRGSNSGLNFNNVSDNVNIILSSNVQSAFNVSGNSVGVDTVYINGFNKFQGGSGNNTLVGADDTNNTLVAGSGNTSVFGGMGLGADSMVGADTSTKNGSSTFFFVTNSNKDTISNFEFLASDKDNATSADRVNFMASTVVNAEVSENNIVVDLSNIEDRLTIENGRGQDIQIGLGGNNFVAKVDSSSLAYDGTANLFMATGKNAVVEVASGVTGSANIMLGYEEVAGIRSDAIFYGNIKELNASNMDGRAVLVGNVNDNIIRAAQGDSTLWGGGSTESNDTLVGGNGHDMFWYGKGQGKDRISNADSNDVINLYDMTLDDIASYEVTATSIAFTDKQGGSLTVESNSGTEYRLSDGSAYIYSTSENQWTRK